MTERHFTYLMDIFPGEWGANLEKFVFALGVGALLVCLGVRANRALQRDGVDNHIIPHGRFGLVGFFDVFMENFIGYHDSILGKHNRKFLPLSASVFLFVFTANLIGLIPGLPAVTTTVWVNVGVALVVFFGFNFYGVKENGVVGYIKHFFGGPELTKWPLICVGVLILFVELISTVLRVLTLNLRLYWNIVADHIVLGTFTGLIPWLIPIPFYCLGLFVCFMQAFVFTVLTMIYIQIATFHEEGAH